MDPLIVIILLILLLGGASAATKSRPASSTSYQTGRFGRIDHTVDYENMDPSILRDLAIAELQAYLEDHPEAEKGHSSHMHNQTHFALDGVVAISSFTNGYVSEVTTGDLIVKAVDQESRVITESFRNPESIKGLEPKYIRTIQYLIHWGSLSFQDECRNVRGLLEYNEHIREQHIGAPMDRFVSKGISFVANELSRRMGTTISAYMTLMPSEVINEDGQKIVADRLVHASIGEYRDWLEGFRKNGGEVTHHYTYPFSRQQRDFFVAKADFPATPRYGADSINIIVPEGVNFLGGNIGHSTLYFMDGYRMIGHFAPSFSDI
ncbi:MAG: hypothetical protein Q7S53_05665 [bacterium]|nr:hypothetical protein [bacterium]